MMAAGAPDSRLTAAVHSGRLRLPAAPPTSGCRWGATNTPNKEKKLKEWKEDKSEKYLKSHTGNNEEWTWWGWGWGRVQQLGKLASQV